MKILITGATGLIGKKLGIELSREGHDLFVITRNKRKAQDCLPFPCQIIEQDLTQGRTDLEEPFDAVINLMGEPIAQGRWTAKKKERLITSRVQATENLKLSLKFPPRIYVGASAVGFYRDGGDSHLSEDSPAGDGFLSYLCQNWEAKHREIESESHYILRIGIVISEEGGALGKMIPLFKLGAGGTIGNGRQWMSWIDIDDLVRLFQFIVENQIGSGTYNAVSPSPVQNREFSAILAQSLGKSLGPPVPKGVLRLIFGEMSQVLLDSQRVLSEKILSAGFQFQYPHLRESLCRHCEPFREGRDLFIFESFYPVSTDKLFEFFMVPENLKKITPPEMRLRILSCSDPRIKEGSVANYAFNVFGIPLKWQARIEDFQQGKAFSDLQDKGPYPYWRHAHEFIPLKGGSLLRDRICFKYPFGFIGKALLGWWLTHQLQKTFDFRRDRLRELFT